MISGSPLSRGFGFIRHCGDGSRLKNVTALREVIGSMHEHEWLAERFEENRGHLRGIAYRMLGSLSEADDAVQEAWLKLSRSGAGGIQDLRAWLTTVVARVCLDLLRSRNARREDSQGFDLPQASLDSPTGMDPETEALLAESVGLALLVVLEKLEPAERLAFVLHDMFAVPFEEIGPIVGRSTEAARQLASRARRRVRGAATDIDADLAAPDRASHRQAVEAFLAAIRAGDFEGLVAVLDPDVVVRAEGPEGIREFRGARNWAKGAVAFTRQARFMQAALVDGAAGIVLAPRGRLTRAVRFTITAGRIVAVEVIAQPEHLKKLEVAVFD
jgi:RNA polymerase sigma factor (sigma-70 family)